MPPLYKNRFLFFLKLSILFFIFLIILTNIKSPILNKKNFFTLSAKSPEYEIFPIIREVEVSYHKPQVVSESNTLSMKTKHIKNCKFEIQAKMSEEKTEEFDYQFA